MLKHPSHKFSKAARNDAALCKLSLCFSSLVSEMVITLQRCKYHSLGALIVPLDFLYLLQCTNELVSNLTKEGDGKFKAEQSVSVVEKRTLPM